MAGTYFAYLVTIHGRNRLYCRARERVCARVLFARFARAGKGETASAARVTVARVSFQFFDRY